MGFFYHNQHGENILNLLTTQLTAFVLCIHLQVQSPSPSPCSQMYLCDSSSVKISPLCSPLLLPSLDPSLSLSTPCHTPRRMYHLTGQVFSAPSQTHWQGLSFLYPQVENRFKQTQRSFPDLFVFLSASQHVEENLFKCVSVCVSTYICVCLLCLHNYVCILIVFYCYVFIYIICLYLILCLCLNM